MPVSIKESVAHLYAHIILLCWYKYGFFIIWTNYLGCPLFYVTISCLLLLTCRIFFHVLRVPRHMAATRCTLKTLTWRYRILRPTAGRRFARVKTTKKQRSKASSALKRPTVAFKRGRSSWRSGTFTVALTMSWFYLICKCVWLFAPLYVSVLQCTLSLKANYAWHVFVYMRFVGLF